VSSRKLVSAEAAPADELDARAQQVVERLPGQRIERREAPAHQISTSLFVQLAGHVPPGDKVEVEGSSLTGNNVLAKKIKRQD